MKISVKQVFVALISMILTLGALWAGQRVYRQTAVASPLVTSIGHLQGVSKVQLVGSDVTVRLKPNANLMAVYRSVEVSASNALGHAPKSITVVSHPDKFKKGFQTQWQNKRERYS